MLYINNLTADAFQNLTLTGIPGIQVSLNLSYRPRVQQWYADVGYGSFALQGLAVVCSPNLLRQWKNVLPFGLACLRTDGLDPYTINDFADGIANLFFLDSADVIAIEQTLFDGE